MLLGAASELAYAENASNGSDAEMTLSATKDADMVHWSAAEKHASHVLERIRSAHLSGKTKKADSFTKEYLRSRDAKLIAVREAWKALKSHLRPSKKFLPSIATGLNAWEGTTEPVIFRPKPKKTNPHDFRIIFEYGIENRALQYLVRSALTARADLHPNQYLLKGAHAAIAEVAKLMAHGYVWAIETDISNCYPSFDGEKVGGLLPIPERVTRRTLLSESLTLKAQSFWAETFGPAGEEYATHSELADARRGFPQGSAASPLAVEILLAPIFAQLPPSGVMIGYADNFLAMARTEADAVSMSLAFRSALKAHPAGQLRPKLPKPFPSGVPLDFLGHRLILGDTVHIEPTPENLVAFEAELSAGLKRIKSAKTYARRSRHMERARGYVRSWAANFSACTEIASIRDEALMCIGAAA